MRTLRYVFLSLTGLLVIVLLLLFTVDLGRFQGTVESLASKALDRTVIVNGELSIRLGQRIEVVAEDLQIADAPWTDQEAFVRVPRLALVVEAASLLSPTVRINSVQLDRPGIRLAVSPADENNWQLGRASAGPSQPLHSLPVSIADARINGLTITYTSPDREQPLVITGDKISLRGSGNEPLRLEADGAVNGTPFSLRARAQTAESVIALGSADIKMSGNLGEVAFDGALAIGSLSNPSKPVARLRLQGPNVEYLSKLLGTRPITTGALDLTATVLPENDLMAVRLNGQFGEFMLSTQGYFDTLDSLSRVDSTFSASGPDASRVGQLLGIDTLPAQPFDVGGAVNRRGSNLTVEALRIAVGESELTLDATFSDFPDPRSGRVNARAAGPDFGHFNRLFGLPGRLTGPFSANGTLLPADDGGALVGLTIAAADIDLAVDGTIAPAKAFAGSVLVVSAQGPDFGTVARAGGLVQAPASPFTANLKLARADRTTAVESFTFSTEDVRLTASGTVSDQPLNETAVKFTVTGQDLASTLVAYGRNAHSLPTTGFEASGELQFEDGTLALREVTARVGDNGDYRLTLNGRVSNSADYIGSRLRLRGEGTSLAALAQVAGVDGAPDAPFELAGEVSRDRKGIMLREVEATVAGATLTASGRVGQPPGLDGMRTTVTIAGPELSVLAPGVEALAPFNQAFRLAAQASVSNQLLTVSDLTASYDGLDVSGDVKLGLSPLGDSGRFALRAASADILRVLAAIANEQYSESASLAMDARGEWSGNAWSIDSLSVKLGESTLSVQGTLDGPPGFDRTDLKGRLDIPDLSPYSALARFPLPPEPVTMEFAMAGTRNEVRLEPLRATVGSSDLDGMASYAIGDVPNITVALNSRRLDLAPFLPELVADDSTPDTGEPAAQSDRLIPDTPIPVEKARGVEVAAQIDIGELRLRRHILTDVGLQGRVTNGIATVSRLHFTSAREELFEASATLEPSANGASLLLQVDGSALAVGLPATTREDIDVLPRYDVQAVMQGDGATTREMAASLNGYVRLVAGAGRIKAGSARLFTNDFLSSLLNAVNPFAKTDEHTDVECAVVLVSVKDGLVEGKPAAVMLSNRLKVMANATVNLATEKLDVAVQTVPQKGLGISVTNLVNPYVKVGGTLASPNLVLNTQGAVIEGGAAVATGGLSFLARRFQQRFLSSKDPCGDAVTKTAPEFLEIREAILGPASVADAVPQP